MLLAAETVKIGKVVLTRNNHAMSHPVKTVKRQRRRIP
jgi:hypothetical protein